jgi:hypothetical protein
VRVRAAERQALGSLKTLTRIESALFRNAEITLAEPLHLHQIVRELSRGKLELTARCYPLVSLFTTLDALTEIG